MPRELIERSPRDDVAALVLPVIGREHHAASRLEESMGLVEALGVDLAFAERVHVRDPHPARLFGAGQVDALSERMGREHVTLLVVDGALTPVQQRNLETELQLKVVDRHRADPGNFRLARANRGRPASGGNGAIAL